MELAEAERRDRVLRDFFDGKDWDGNEEFALKRELVRTSQSHLPDWPLLIEDEWECVDNATNLGRGDLVFTDGHGRFAVVEVKHLSGESGKTGRNRRTKKRKAVEDQARSYALVYHKRPGVKEVRAFVFINDPPGSLATIRAVERQHTDPT